MTVRDIKIQIFKFFRPLIEAPNLGKGAKKNSEKILEEEYKYFFEKKDGHSGGYESDNPLYAIYINNNLPVENGIITSS